MSCGDWLLGSNQQVRKTLPEARLRSLVFSGKIGEKEPGTGIRPIRCFRGGRFHGEPLCPGNGQRGDGASQGAAVAETVRKCEDGAAGKPKEKNQSYCCHHCRHHHGRSKADIAARVSGSPGALPRPRSQRKGARLILAWGAAAFGEGPRETVLCHGAWA